MQISLNFPKYIKSHFILHLIIFQKSLQILFLESCKCTPVGKIHFKAGFVLWTQFKNTQKKWKIEFY